MATDERDGAKADEMEEAAPFQPADAGPSAASLAELFADSGYELAVHPAHIIRRAHQRATMRFQEMMGEHDLTPTQMAALATIMKHGEVSQNQLGRLTAMDPSTISIVIRKLLKHGLVIRSASADDQRLSLIRLSDEGVRFTLPLLKASVAVGRRVLAPLKPSERALFMEMLVRVADGEDEPAGET